MPQRRKGTNTESRYTKRRDTQHTRRHKWRGDTHRKGGHTEWRHIRKREEGYGIYGERTHIERGQTRRGDYIRKGLHGEGTHTEKRYMNII